MFSFDKTCDGQCCGEAKENLQYFDGHWALIIDVRGVIVFYCPYCGKRLE